MTNILLYSPGNLLLFGISMCWRISLAFQNCCSSGKMTNSLCLDCWDKCQSSEGGPTNSEKTKTFRTINLGVTFRSGEFCDWTFQMHANSNLSGIEISLQGSWCSCILENNVCRGGQKIWPPADPWNDLGERGRVEMMSRPLQLKTPPQVLISRQELSNVLPNHDRDGYGQRVS